MTRRTFVGTVLPAAGAAGANDRISIGIIGAGGRGTYDLNEIIRLKPDHNAAVTAICDVYRPNREKAAAAAAKAFNVQPKTTVDYHELLSWKDVDAVIIATPDFGHSPILEAAAKAGKDVYCEKPMGVEFKSAKSAYLAVKKTDRVVQIGTQRRSEGPCMAAAKAIQSGMIGQVTRVDIGMNFQEPRWRRDFSKVPEADVAWRQFLLGKSERPFDARRLREWQLFRDYTNGIAGLWMCHFIDLVHWWLEDPYPAGAVAAGGVYLWKDGRETEDVFHALLDYPKGFLVSFAMSLTNSAFVHNLWFGTKGTLDADKFVVSGEGSSRPDKLAAETKLQPLPTTSHMQDFIDCVRTRKTPRADIQAGFSHAVAGCMAAEALMKGRRIRFDREKLELA